MVTKDMTNKEQKYIINDTMQLIELKMFFKYKHSN